MNEYLLIIPAFNEEKNISKVLDSIINLNLPIDILVINDGSKDQTGFIVGQYPVFSLSHPTNLGVGSAIQTGYQFAANKKYPYVIVFDADGQHDPAYLVKMMEAIRQEHADVVIGSRFLQKSQMKVGCFKLFAVKFFRMLTYTITGKKITDPTSGFRGFKYWVYETLSKSKNFPNDFPDCNFIIETILNKYKIVEIPVNMYDREHGISMHSGLKPIVYVLQIMLSIFVIVLRHKLLPQRKKLYG
jgi:glycosyltransferase involved in cell wall biosynthesis